ncbi:hypothetical protein B0J12DRAFT_326241 [Macrophomina phaseolina]|uniref:Uncharacterized protein n=1 Tax=Macrophomina phaseolina TaxID=35725 RepID=A0ABQ8FY03_9PEZI|nr:hypothetical protein B0J12DRAFT_326241 [Macrophomina phaseolina]
MSWRCRLPRCARMAVSVGSRGCHAGVEGQIGFTVSAARRAVATRVGLQCEEVAVHRSLCVLSGRGVGTEGWLSVRQLACCECSAGAGLAGENEPGLRGRGWASSARCCCRRRRCLCRRPLPRRQIPHLAGPPEPAERRARDRRVPEESPHQPQLAMVQLRGPGEAPAAD